MSPFYENQSQCTISLLPVSLSLVHIPRSRLTQLSHPIIRLILQPKPAFLNVTCNEIELSIFAEHHMLEDFELLSRRDRQRQRSRSGSSASRKGSLIPAGPLEMSYERWNVLQIDSHSDVLENAGARVSELSAPLAAAGISILYQSSYMSDFIFVKESRLHEVMSLLSQAGFDLYSADQDPWSLPSKPDDIHTIVDRSTTTVLTKSRSTADMSALSTSPKITPSERPKPSLNRQKSHSPTNVDITVLDPDLACVGLSEDCIDIWSLKIVKLVAFPDLIRPSRKTSPSTPITKTGQYSALFGVPYSSLSPISIHSPLSSSSTSSSDEEGYFSHSPRDGSHSTGSLTSGSRSFTDLSNVPSSTLKSASKHTVSSTALDLYKLSSSLASVERDSPVSFFSFTRTSEGSSLTMDISLLAVLFPPQERHMVICSGEFDALSDTAELDEQDWDAQTVAHKCLQIDLRRFGLDKHGLVNRFSRVLEENNINHMYSSTFKTANLLVDKRHALRARSLLSAC